MYRATPVTYFVSAMISTGISGINITCSTAELVRFSPPRSENCGSYLAEYISYAGGTLLDPNATEECRFCPISTTDSLLATLGIDVTARWRNLGISLVYTATNILGSLLLYWVVRVPKGAKNT